MLSAGRLWQVVTYAFVHSPSGLIWFAIEMYMLFAFGREVERFIGRRAFIFLYLLLLCAPPLLLSVWGIWQRTGLAGSATIHFAIFIAFAAIYPNVELFLRIMAKWVALVFVAAYSLQLLAFHGWSELVVLWVSVGPGLRLYRTARRWPRTRLVDGLDFALAIETFAQGRPASDRPPGRGTGRHLRFDRPGPRQNFEIRHRQPDRQRTAGTRSGAQSAPEKIRVSEPATASLRLSVIVPSWKDHASLARLLPELVRLIDLHEVIVADASPSAVAAEAAQAAGVVYLPPRNRTAARR